MAKVTAPLMAAEARGAIGGIEYRMHRGSAIVGRKSTAPPGLNASKRAAAAAFSYLSQYWSQDIDGCKSYLIAALGDEKAAAAVFWDRAPRQLRILGNANVFADRTFPYDDPMEYPPDPNFFQPVQSITVILPNIPRATILFKPVDFWTAGVEIYYRPSWSADLQRVPEAYTLLTTIYPAQGFDLFDLPHRAAHHDFRVVAYNPNNSQTLGEQWFRGM